MRLPSFADLLAFDAVARVGTLTRAAKELNVSQPAISRRLASLESDLGKPLFNRNTKPLTLTATGLELFDVLRSGLSRLESAVERIRSTPGVDTVTLSAGSGLTAYWLIPRLPAMQAAFPELRLRIISQSHENQEDSGGDLQIRFGGGIWRGMTSLLLFQERVFPVASPMYLRQRPVPWALADISGEALLDMKVNQQPWFDWRSWLAAVRAPAADDARILYFDSYPLVVGAALAGQGICLAWSGLLEQFLGSGALVRVSDRTAESSTRGYFITYPQDLRPEAHAPRIARWLIESSEGLQSNA